MQRRNADGPRKSTALFATLALIGPLASGQTVSAQETLSTLTLDSLSFISFGDRAVFAIPSGATLQLRFGSPQDDGSVPFVIHPDEVAIPPIALESEPGTLTYTLQGDAQGVVEQADSGLSVELTATIAATLEGAESSGTKIHTLRFSTASASATNLFGTESVSVTGMQLDPEARYLQLVGATTNPETARPEPGAAVYAVLSGTLDKLPDVP